ncbi:MAG: hypothetical protein U0T36_08280 [Saprospiraceae bacterium]
MMRYLFLFLMVTNLSCSKDEIPVTKNIVGWTDDVPAQNRDLYKIRLAFGKTIASALKEQELRDYINKRALCQISKFFKSYYLH